MLPRRRAVSTLAIFWLTSTSAWGQAYVPHQVQTKPSPGIFQQGVKLAVPQPPQKPQAKSIVVPDLSQPGQRSNFSSYVSELCHIHFKVDETSASADSAQGTFVGPSNPPQGSIIHCGDPVTVTLSSGPAPPPPAVPADPSEKKPQPKPIIIPDLSTPGRRNRFSVYVSERCHIKFQFQESRQSAASDPDTFLGTDPPQGKVFYCGDAVSIIRSSVASSSSSTSASSSSSSGGWGSAWFAASAVALAALAALGVGQVRRRIDRRRLARTAAIVAEGGTLTAHPLQAVPAVAIEIGARTVTFHAPPRLSVKVMPDA